MNILKSVVIGYYVFQGLSEWKAYAALHALEKSICNVITVVILLHYLLSFYPLQRVHICVTSFHTPGLNERRKSGFFQFCLNKYVTAKRASRE